MVLPVHRPDRPLRAKLEAKLQKLRDEGVSVCGVSVCTPDLAPEPIPDAQNAATHFVARYPDWLPTAD